MFAPPVQAASVVGYSGRIAAPLRQHLEASMSLIRKQRMKAALRQNGQAAPRLWAPQLFALPRLAVAAFPEPDIYVIK
jgi:hypothetical protein